LAIAERFGAYLPRKVDGEGVIDGYEIVILGNIIDIANVGNGKRRDHRVSIHKIIELSAAESEAAYDFVSVQGLFFAVDHPLVYEGHHGICEHLGMDSEILFVLKLEAHCVCDISYTELQARAVRDLFDDILGDFPVVLIRRSIGQYREVMIRMANAFDLAYMNMSIYAIYKGSFSVHLHDNLFRVPRSDAVIEGAQRAITHESPRVGR
jgi:hypothetical protein